MKTAFRVANTLQFVSERICYKGIALISKLFNFVIIFRMNDKNESTRRMEINIRHHNKDTPCLTSTFLLDAGCRCSIVIFLVLGGRFHFVYGVTRQETVCANFSAQITHQKVTSQQPILLSSTCYAQFLAFSIRGRLIFDRIHRAPNDDRTLTAAFRNCHNDRTTKVRPCHSSAAATTSGRFRNRRPSRETPPFDNKLNRSVPAMTKAPLAKSEFNPGNFANRSREGGNES